MKKSFIIAICLIMIFSGVAMGKGHNKRGRHNNNAAIIGGIAAGLIIGNAIQPRYPVSQPYPVYPQVQIYPTPRPIYRVRPLYVNCNMCHLPDLSCYNAEERINFYRYYNDWKYINRNYHK